MSNKSFQTVTSSRLCKHYRVDRVVVDYLLLTMNSHWAAGKLQYQPRSWRNISQNCWQKIVHDHMDHTIVVVAAQLSAVAARKYFCSRDYHHHNLLSILAANFLVWLKRSPWDVFYPLFFRPRSRCLRGPAPETGKKNYGPRLRFWWKSAR